MSRMELIDRLTKTEQAAFVSAAADMFILVARVADRDELEEMVDLVNGLSVEAGGSPLIHNMESELEALRSQVVAAAERTRKAWALLTGT